MRRLICGLGLLVGSLNSWAQMPLQGEMRNTEGKTLPFGTVALLDVADSTLRFFAITDGAGAFLIKDTKPGPYLLQASFLGYETLYRSIQLPADAQAPLLLLLQPKANQLGGVEVSDERIPIRLNRDTVEYDAGAFKTREDAPVEDLLKKLPGVEVDRAGNVKAMGENVKRVLVDGKEFFGDNPQMATRNLPADAIKKVQVYDQKSEEAELTGMDDGSREKTINLMLKDDKKSAWMGEARLAGGTNQRFKSEAKAFRFSQKHQFAALGMGNNINQVGFNMQDYLSFNGGLGSVMQGGGIQLGGSGNLPVDFGQPQTGIIRSAAGGLNYNYEPRKFHRFHSSLLSNHSNKWLEESSFSQNFLPNGSFERESDMQQRDRNTGHRLNLGYRNRIDSMRNLQSSAYAGWSLSRRSTESFSRQFQEKLLLNSQDALSNTLGDQWESGGQLSYLQRLRGRFTILRLRAEAGFRGDLSETDRRNLTLLTGNPLPLAESFFQRNQSQLQRYDASASGSYRLQPNWALEPELRWQYRNESLNRKQGILGNEAGIDSLSPDFNRQYTEWSPRLRLRKLGGKYQFQLQAGAALAQWQNALWQQSLENTAAWYPMASLLAEKEYQKGRRWSVRYDTRLQEAAAVQLLPVPNVLNPLQLVLGNPQLRPEFIQSVNMNWMLFDQFSFTSLFAGLQFTHTRDKVNWERQVAPNLFQQMRPVNMPNDYRLSANADFSTPWRKAGLMLRLRAAESWNRGFNLINGDVNRTDNFTHNLTFSIENRKKEKLDWSTGFNWQRTDAFFSLQQNLNQVFVQTGFFADLSYQPNALWNISTHADVARFDDRAFAQVRWVPLVRAELQRFVLPNKRGMLSLEVFDLLNRNLGINRVGDANFLLETRSNRIGRYVLLGFKYRLNKFDGGQNGGVKIEMRR